MKIILLLTVLFCIFVPIVSANDLPSSWAASQVEEAIVKNLVPQNLRSNYTQPITRAEFCALAVVLYESVKGEITSRATFSDTNDINVEKMAFAGVVSGVGNNKFSPDKALTREQAAVMLSNLSDSIGQPFPIMSAAFADNNLISQWATISVGRVLAAEIMSGTGNNFFSPEQPYTREQSIITILQTFKWANKNVDVTNDYTLVEDTYNAGRQIVDSPAHVVMDDARQSPRIVDYSPPVEPTGVEEARRIVNAHYSALYNEFTIRFIGEVVLSENQPIAIEAYKFEISREGTNEICAVSKNHGRLYTWFENENGAFAKSGWTTHIGGGARAD